jgi:hypothetical protein
MERFPDVALDNRRTACEDRPFLQVLVDPLRRVPQLLRLTTVS